MTTEQKQAYEWAKSQSYQSVAARYAKELCGVIDDLQAENAELKRRLDGINDFEKSQCAKLLEKLSRVEAERDVYRALGTIEELSALVKARDEGRVVVLPCNVGTKVWVTSAYGTAYHPPKEAKVVQFVLHDDEIMYLEALLWMDLGAGKKKYGYSTKAFGRAVFLTRAEAEAAIGGGQT